MTSEFSQQSYTNCTLCPRNCGANRVAGEKGFCGMGAEVTVAKAYRHQWEEPCLTGENGSGTVFFTGCNLRCVFCQNAEISAGGRGKAITAEELSEVFLHLQTEGAANINLVTGVCFLPHIAESLLLAKQKGLTIPTVYNSSGYESVASIKKLAGLIDIYLPDFKYLSSDLAGKLSHAPDYPEVAKAALAEMFSQTGPAVFDEKGMMQRGVLVRHLVLPGQVPDSKRVLRYLHETYGNGIFISIMNQYTPMESVKEDPLLSRRVTEEEYRRVLDFAESIGIENGFVQEGEAARESFIPHWDFEGIETSPQ